MSGNRSLDEFAGADGEDGTDGQRSEDAAAPGAADDAVAEPAVERDSSDPAPDVDPDRADDDVEGSGADRREPDPPASTYAWSPEGGECVGCGATVEERWRDGDDLVCVSCKDW